MAFGFVLFHSRATPKRLSHAGCTVVEESAWVLGFPYQLPHLGPVTDCLKPLRLIVLTCIFGVTFPAGLAGLNMMSIEHLARGPARNKRAVDGEALMSMLSQISKLLAVIHNPQTSLQILTWQLPRSS